MMMVTTPNAKLTTVLFKFLILLQAMLEAMATLALSSHRLTETKLGVTRTET